MPEEGYPSSMFSDENILVDMICVMIECLPTIAFTSSKYILA